MIRCAEPLSGGGTTIQMMGSVFKGPVKNATILLRSLAPDGTVGEVLERIQTTDNGSFTFSMDPSRLPLHMQTVSGGFVDEATGKWVTLSESKTLDCILYEAPPGNSNTIHITPLTTLAAQLSLTLAANKETTKDADTYAKKQIANLFGLSNFLSIRPSDLTDEEPDIPDSNGTRYALVVAGLSGQTKHLAELYQDLSLDVMVLIKAIVEDITDGILDGKKKLNGMEEPIEMGTNKIPLPFNAIAQSLVLGIKNFLKSSQNKSGLTEADEMVKDLIDKMEKNPASMMKIMVTPIDVSIIVGMGAKKHFRAEVIGLLQDKVQWSVEGMIGGNSEMGTITQEGEYSAPQMLPSSGETVTIRATSSVMPKIFGEVKLKLKKVISISPTKRSVQINSQSVFDASIAIPEMFVEWFVNDIKWGNEKVGTIHKIEDLKVIYTAPKNITEPTAVILKIQSIANPLHYATAELILFETKAVLRYEGFLYDLVSKKESPAPGDGLDAVFKLELDNGGDFSESISSVSLGKLNNVGWDTISDNGSYLLGISEDKGSPLLNHADGTIDVLFQNRKKYFLYVNDFSDTILSGGDYQLSVGLTSGRILSLAVNLKKTLLVENEISLSGIQPLYSFVGITSVGHIKASGPDPLQLRSEGNMVISGVVSADGENGENGGSEPGKGGSGGAGSSDGGDGGFGNEESGKGIGGGKNIKLKDKPVGGGGGGYGTSGGNGNGAGGGIVYGNDELHPLIGGSGGAGGENHKKKSKGGGGGGGGGAIYLYAKRDIVISGTIRANGGNGGNGGFDDDDKVQASGGGGGSGGGILIQFDEGIIILKQDGQIMAKGGLSGNLGGKGGHGRISIKGPLIKQGIIDPYKGF